MITYADGKLFKDGKRYGRDCGRYRKCGTGHYEHRFIWEMFYGPIPEGMVIDHVNHDGHDNRIENLRLATKTQNQMNRKSARGYNVTKGGRYIVQFGYEGNKYYVGTFDTPEEAKGAYLKKKAELAGEYAHG